jgi:hypothetical protein
VDADFYHGVYRDQLFGRVDPVADYMEKGWREGRDPAPWFSTQAYLTAHADIAAAGINPLHHYLTQGRLEGREIGRSPEAERYFAEVLPADGDAGWTFHPGDRPRRAARRPTPATKTALLDQRLRPGDREAVAAEFDATFYLELYTDVASAGMDPLDHFLTFGWQEGRDPNPAFSVKSYLEINPDVAAAGLNPFVHYVTTGRAEGRATREQLGFRHDIIAHLIPVTDRLAACDRALGKIAADDRALLSTALASGRSGLSDLYVSFSHDNYADNLGGVQLCLQREARAAQDDGRDHLHLFPAAARPMIRDRREGALWGVLFNESLVGHFTPAEVISVVGDALAGGEPGRRAFAIHSLLGHHVEDVIGLLEVAGLSAGYYWLHDFTSVCAGVHLMRNDVADCGAPPIESPACGICIYGPYRRGHVEAHHRLFQALDLTVVAPSQATLDTWRRGPGYRVLGATVLPHARLVARGRAVTEGAEEALRVAYLGFPVDHKGWPIFRDLALKYAEDPRYRFIHIGKAPAPGLRLEFHPAKVGPDQQAAMQAAIEEAKVDVVLIWPLCRETFSFVTYEAAAAGAAILTNPDSGNVAAFVADHNCGMVLSDEHALDSLFADGTIDGLARARRKPALFDLAYSALTLDLLREAGR